MGSLSVPPWLESLLSTTFFSPCQIHTGAARNECNMYCLDCEEGAFCFYCRSTQHKEHQVIQIRRSSYHNVVRVAEIQKVLDISGVQTYVINSARVLFLNERPQPKTNLTSGKAASHFCEICARSLSDPFHFCSLGCKLVGIKENGNGSFMMTGGNQDGRVGRGEGMARRLASREAESVVEEADGLREGMQRQVHRSTACTPPPPPPLRPRSNSRRKGIPRRSPLMP